MRQNRLLALGIALLLITALCGCKPQPPPQHPLEEAVSSIQPPLEEATPASEVRVVVTQDFGAQLMLDKTVELKDDMSAMDALQEVAEVETAYGGGFVGSINDVRSQYQGKSKAKRDWFFYVNGISSNMGAADYKLQSGDMEHWDFHDWSFHHFIPALVGSFPEPFRHGYGGKVYPSIVAYAEGFAETAQALAEKLAQLGVEKVSTQNIHQLSEDDKGYSNLVILGTKDSALISELDRIYAKLGFYAHFRADRLVVLNSKGEIAAQYEAGSGLIQATQNPWNPRGIGASECVVWMVTGTHEAGVEAAASALINRHTKLKYTYAAAVINGEIVKVPGDKLQIPR